MPEFIDAHGVAIVYDVHPAKTDARAVVQLAHGWGSTRAGTSALIDALTADGYTVYADDHRGHGRTGTRQHGGDRPSSAARAGRVPCRGARSGRSPS